MTRLLLTRTILRHTLLGAAALCALGTSSVTFTGCASPGIPRPPSLHLPATVTDLTASRIGDRVELSWTAPTRTTDGLELADPQAMPTTVEVCRDVVSGKMAADGARCTPALRVAGHAGASEVVDAVPVGLRAEAAKGVVLAYRVRVLNRSGRGAASSAPVLIACGPAVDEVVGFSAKETRRGVLLQWSGAGDGVVEVLRTTTDAVRGAAPRGPGGGSKEAAATERLRAGSAAERRMLDVGVMPNGTYTYQARRVREVELEGERVVMRSEASESVTIVRRDVFPPEPPTGLASVPGGTTARPTIDLSWRAGGETDLRGYLVYRREAGAGEWLRVSAEALSGPAFRDSDVVAGRRYEYRVTAVDGRGNQSAPSNAVAETAGGGF